MTASAQRPPPSSAWYRQPWPWILMSGPLIVVVASLITAWIAYRTQDGLVAENYYQQGLAAHRTIARSELADHMGLTATLSSDTTTVTVGLDAKNAEFTAPAALIFSLSHPTRAGLDQTTMLIPAGKGYQGKLRMPSSGHWIVMVEDERKTWRLLAPLVLPTNFPVQFGNETAARSRTH